MKLSLFITLIDLLIILVYPFVFIWDKLHPSAKSGRGTR
jgi:hypothetical protein